MQIKEAGAVARSTAAGGACAMKTYTMYLRRADEPAPAFEPVLCANDIEAIRKARELLSQRPAVTAIDVYFGEDLLVTVS